jgi:aminoglycoside phosphotransferase (APT) family kinase protein
MTSPQWKSDIAIDVALATRLIAEQFPKLAPLAVEPLGSGWDNAAFTVDGRIGFRFPRRTVAANLIGREIAALPRIAPLVPLAIPAPTYIGAPTNDYPWYFAGYPLIAGTTADSHVLSDATRATFAEPLGAFLAALHAIDPRPFTVRGLPPDEIGRLDHEKRIRQTRERRDVVTAAGFGPLFETALAWLEAHPPQACADAARTIVHGDLYARHVLLDDADRITGIIDWGDIHHGDPALDLMIVHLAVPSAAYDIFRAAYGPIDDRMWAASRYRAMYHAIIEIEYGVRIGDPAMRDAGLTGLRLMNAKSG